MGVGPPIKHGCARVGHKTPEYLLWCAMIERCENSHNKRYAIYGGRGIKVCRRWRDSFADFLADLGNRPGKGYTLDRFPNKDGDYEPGNVRWATHKEQQRNRRNNRLLTFAGKTFCVSEWAERLKVPTRLLTVRLFRGWPIERALTEGILA